MMTTPDLCGFESTMAHLLDGKGGDIPLVCRCDLPAGHEDQHHAVSPDHNAEFYWYDDPDEAGFSVRGQWHGLRVHSTRRPDESFSFNTFGEKPYSFHEEIYYKGIPGDAPAPPMEH